jgi:hypothetical protein
MDEIGFAGFCAARAFLWPAQNAEHGRSRKRGNYSEGNSLPASAAWKVRSSL